MHQVLHTTCGTQASLNMCVACCWLSSCCIDKCHSFQVQYGKQSQELKRPASSTIADLKAEVGAAHD
jgi:hypothetical protein